MDNRKKDPYGARLAMSASSTAMAAAMAAGLTLVAPAFAQSNEATGDDDVVIITGTRIQNPNVIAASPVNTVGIEEIARKFTPNVERIFRDLPITIPGDGQNVNNGTEGRATINLRGLGAQRSLVMIDGKRLNPHDIDGEVDISILPINMLERIDVITGGASAVYGSDAMSGAVNFILKKDFEGFEIDAGYSTTDQGGGGIKNVGVLFGSNSANGRGNVTVGATWTDRNAVLLADRDFGLFGVSSETGSGLGSPPEEPAADCSGNTEFTTAHSTGVGSTTAIPATLNLGSGDNLQFRDNGSLVLGECARFNFNPFNYYQTPQERWQATATAHYEINDFVEVYGRASFMANESVSQIAPSGTFGQTFEIPVANPFFDGAAQQTIIDSLVGGAASNVAALNAILAVPMSDPNFDQDAFDAATAALAADPNQFVAVGINDLNNDGVFDQNDTFNSTARRRTLELGPRTSIFDTDVWQFVGGLRGQLPESVGGWNYDFSWQRGESDFIEVRDGFTNLNNLQAGINTVDASQCIDLQGNVTATPCTPINIFGPVGSITDAQRDSGFFIAIANDVRKATQSIVSLSLDGQVDQLKSPFATNPISVATGFEYRKETATSSPDECLKEPPSSCQGGAGGSRLPVSASYRAWEGYVEAIMPVIEGRQFFESLSIEAGYRYSDFNPQGQTDTWKAGFSWQPVSSLRLRYMEQQAVRVPNIGEIGTPISTGLDDATFDPCSVGNPNPPAQGSELFNLCVDTGVPIFLVGQVPDIISGQVNVFNGTNTASLPDPETARTRTAGFIFQPDLSGLGVGGLSGTLSVDYYNIKISNYIDEPSGQEAFDLCYVAQLPQQCAGIVRALNGSITVSGTGLPAFFTNFESRQAEGIDIVMNASYDFGDIGVATLTYNANYYLTNEFQTNAALGTVDCNGRYGTSCDPVPTYRHNVRLSLAKDPFNASILWRRIGGMEAQASEAAALFPAFRQVDAQNYFDLSAGWQLNETAYISGLVTNIANKNPPILGNETGSTEFNSGNTFPSLYDTLGRVYSVNLKLSF